MPVSGVVPMVRAGRVSTLSALSAPGAHTLNAMASIRSSLSFTLIGLVLASCGAGSGGGRVFRVPSESMIPTIARKAKVVVDESKASSVKRGDIIVFNLPATASGGKAIQVIKRVIAIGGDTVQGTDCHIELGGSALPEPYVREKACTSNFRPQSIPDGMLWVMGDNRMNSEDSRLYGPVPMTAVIGVVVDIQN